jgi:parallel beta-helix repeat protein
VTGNTVHGVNNGIVFWYGITGNYVADNTATGNSNNDFYCPDSSTQTDGGGNVCNSKNGCGWLTSCPSP